MKNLIVNSKQSSSNHRSYLILFVIFSLSVFSTKVNAQTLLGQRNLGNVAEITATQANLFANLNPISLGWVMYAGGAPVDPVSQNAYLNKTSGQIVELTPSATQTLLVNLGSFNTTNWSYPMVRMTNGTLVAINQDGQLVKIVGTTASLHANLGTYSPLWSRISIDDKNNILTTSTAGKVIQVDPDGTQTLIADLSGTSTKSWLKSLLGSDGNHYMLNNDGKVFQSDPCGIQLFVDLSQFNSDNSWLNFANHPNGNIYAVNYFDGQVAEINLVAGTAIILDSFTEVADAWYGPVIDNSGTIYVWQNQGYFKRVYTDGTPTSSISPHLGSIGSFGWYSISVEQYLVNPADPGTCCSGPNIDSDCDGIADGCDICPGGDDSLDNNGDGIPDCSQLLDWNDYPTSWKCANNKVAIGHANGNGNCNTNCVNINALQSHINHGDYVGPCTSCGNSGPQIAHTTNNNSVGAISGISIFPNPARDYFIINLAPSIGNAELKIIDIKGRVIRKEFVEEGMQSFKFEFGSDQVNSGTYFIRLDASNQTFVEQVIVIE